MDLALLVLRVVVGLFFAGHGAQKLWGSFGGHGLAGTGMFFEQLGITPGRRNALVAGAAEFVGGVLFILGLVTPLAAVLIISVMTVAILTVHLPKGPWVTEGGYEYNAVLMAVAFALAGAGPGELSLDDAIGWMPDITGTGWALASLAVGVLAGLGAVMAGRAGNAPAVVAPSPAADDADRVARIVSDRDGTPAGGAAAATTHEPLP